MAPAPVVAPYAYTQILWTTLPGFLFRDEFPTRDTLPGAAIVIASTFHIFFREARTGGIAREPALSQEG